MAPDGSESEEIEVTDMDPVSLRVMSEDTRLANGGRSGDILNLLCPRCEEQVRLTDTIFGKCGCDTQPLGWEVRMEAKGLEKFMKDG